MDDAKYGLFVLAVRNRVDCCKLHNQSFSRVCPALLHSCLSDSRPFNHAKCAQFNFLVFLIMLNFIIGSCPSPLCVCVCVYVRVCARAFSCVSFGGSASAFSQHL